jgi:hypothetical protein
VKGDNNVRAHGEGSRKGLVVVRVRNIIKQRISNFESMKQDQGND